MAAAESSNVTQLPTIPAATELLPFVPAGVYSLVYIAHETHKFFNRSCKAVFWFRITDYGEHFGKVIPRYYNVKRLVGKPGRSGQFVPGRSSDFLREFCRVSTARIVRLDRLPLTDFQRVQIRARVRVVSQDAKQRELPDALRYSVVDELIGLEQ